MGIDKASVGRRNSTLEEKKMVEELRKRLGESLKVKTSNCEDLRLCLNGGQFFSGNALTFADIMLVVLQDNLRSNVIGAGDLIEKFPKMCNLYQRVTALPNIKAWRGSRPIDPMFNN